MSRPKISVVIPTYNRPRRLSRALKSVIGQSYENIEIIVVDDHSETNTMKVVEDCHDDRIRFIEHDVNLGPQHARNTGILNSNGEYIALIDDDDVWFPEKIERELEVIEEDVNVGLVYCGCYDVLESDGSIIRTQTPEFRGDVYDQILSHNILASPTPLIRREAFEVAGLFDVSLPSCQDWDMWIRIARNFKFDYVEEPLAAFYYHGNQISVDLRKRTEGRKKLFRKYRAEMSNPVLAMHLHWLGVNSFLIGKKAEAKAYEREAIRLFSKPRFIISRLLFYLGVNRFRSILESFGRIYEY